ncbi:uncharacterized protein [Panulirus ornatus]|uniref:uncharacterized protein n=1 Tax=Panulirus ornatus TaxID=150431 RepID=UPI003A879E5B
MYPQLVACVAFCASLAAAMPQNYVAPTNHHFVAPSNQQSFVAQTNQQSYVAPTNTGNYQALGVLEPQSRDLGAQEKIVAATIDLLPEIADLFERVTRDRSNDPERIQQIMVDFLPITRKVMYATADVEGRSIPVEDIHRFNAAEAVMPSVITFMNRLRDMDFFGTQNNVDTYQ